LLPAALASPHPLTAWLPPRACLSLPFLCCSLILVGVGIAVAANSADGGPAVVLWLASKMGSGFMWFLYVPCTSFLPKYELHRDLFEKQFPGIVALDELLQPKHKWLLEACDTHISGKAPIETGPATESDVMAALGGAAGDGDAMG